MCKDIRINIADAIGAELRDTSGKQIYGHMWVTTTERTRLPEISELRSRDSPDNWHKRYTSYLQSFSKEAL